MATRIRESTNIAVNVTERSVTYTANTLFQVFLRLVAFRELSPEYIIKDREIIENGLFAWLAEQTLEKVYLEVYTESGSEAIERWDFDIIYEASSNKKTRKPPLQQLEQITSKLKSLPDDTKYRIVVHTSPGAVKVPGWHPTELRQLNESQREEFNGWGYGNISVGFTYRGGKGGKS